MSWGWILIKKKRKLILIFLINFLFFLEGFVETEKFAEAERFTSWKSSASLEAWRVGSVCFGDRVGYEGLFCLEGFE